MMTPPQNQKIVVLGPEQIKAKFEELDMMAYLSQTCNRRKIKRSTKTRSERRYTAEQGETYIRKTDGEGQAIIYWWHLLTGGEDYLVVQFTSPDEVFYTTNAVIHPSKLP